MHSLGQSQIQKIVIKQTHK